MMKNHRIMRKLAIIFIVAVLAFPLVSASSLEKPDWREGDYWNYEIVTVGIERKETSSTTIVGMENITVGNITYRCIVARVKGFIDELLYYDEEDMGIVKETIYDNETNKTEEKIHNPPQFLIKYPIFIGKKWNTTVEWKNDSVILQLECVGKKDITAGAGKFDCYVIKMDYIFPNNTTNPSFYQFYYVSGKVGTIVRTEGYGNGTLVGYTDLLSFHYSASPGEQQDYNTVIVAAASIAVFVSLIALYKFKRSK